MSSSTQLFHTVASTTSQIVADNYSFIILVIGTAIVLFAVSAILVAILKSFKYIIK